MNVTEAKQILQQIDQSNKETVDLLFLLLYKIDTYSNKNKMNSKLLSIVWIPCLFEFESNDPKAYKKNIENVKPFFTLLIENYEAIFSSTSDKRLKKLNIYTRLFNQRTHSSSQQAWEEALQSIVVN